MAGLDGRRAAARVAGHEDHAVLLRQPRAPWPGRATRAPARAARPSTGRPPRSGTVPSTPLILAVDGVAGRGPDLRGVRVVEHERALAEVGERPARHLDGDGLGEGGRVDRRRRTRGRRRPRRRCSAAGEATSTPGTGATSRGDLRRERLADGVGDDVVGDEVLARSTCRRWPWPTPRSTDIIDTRVRPIISAEAVAAVRRGLRHGVLLGHHARPP